MKKTIHIEKRTRGTRYVAKNIAHDEVLKELTGKTSLTEGQAIILASFDFVILESEKKSFIKKLIEKL